jgi:hypothetical protein
MSPRTPFQAPPTRRRLLGLRRLAAAAAGAALTLTLAACGGRAVGYGLVLWGDPVTSFTTGQVLAVAQESSIQETYLVRPEGSRELAEIPSWRVRLYKSREEARVAAEQYAAFRDTYGYSERDGLPIREQAAPEARRVYKLREAQLVKIVSRGDLPVQVAGHDSYWYEVLTEDGARGFCFGAYLPVFTAAGDPKEEVERLRSRDPALETLVATPWRPEYFQEMVDNGRIDLLRFSPEFGLFIDEQAKSVRIVSQRSRQSFTYTSIENVGPNRYVFVGQQSKAELRAQLQTPERLVVTFSRNDQLVSAVYIAFQDDIEAVIAAERQRRQELYDGFAARGRVLNSTAYGRITLQDGMRFLWENYGQLQELVFLKKVQGAGTVDFPYSLAASLTARYDGVISFRFREYGPEQDSTFLYRFASGGVRFESVSPGNIEDLEVVRSDSIPLVIYFSFGSS